MTAVAASIAAKRFEKYLTFLQADYIDLYL